MRLLICLLIVLYMSSWDAVAFQQPNPSRADPSYTTKLFANIEKVTKTNEQWRQELSPQAYYVLREAGTEAPGSSELNSVKEPGTFICRGCGAPLFTTSTKFNSGTGWPSFYRPIDQFAVKLSVDFKLILPRTEVCCASCGGHLGHVFEDGPEPTGQRYCMNGIAMEFRPDVDNLDLAAAILERKSSPFKPAMASQSVMFNVSLCILFFASFVVKIGDIQTVDGKIDVVTFFPIIPSIFYGVLAAQGLSRLI